MKSPILLLFIACCVLAQLASAAEPIRFRTEKPGFVSLNLYRGDGTLARQVLAGAAYPAGEHQVAWDGPASGAPLPPDIYSWKAVFHEGLALTLRGTVGDFGGDRGSPSAATADATNIYLGWTAAGPEGDAVVACDPTGKVLWTHRRGKLSGCQALGVDGGAVYVLGGEGEDADGGALYRLNANDGTPLPWPNGRTDLKITALWPAGSKDKPEIADYMAVKNGRVYLSFTGSEFMAVLDAKTGGYLQTVVGAPPGAVDSVGTKTESKDKPGEMEDADFVITALKGAVLGKLLMMHDPIWVVVSDMTPMERDERITALTVIGDGAKFHMHDVFTGLGQPFHQVQARSVISAEGFTYVAGKPGGRPPTGPWQPAKMKTIRALALDSTGQLWVPEGDNVPARVSVWSTDGAEGKLVREFFAPPLAPAAVDPRDPGRMFAGGCEWQIDAKTGRGSCLGVVTREALRAARYVVEKERLLLVLTPEGEGGEMIFERAGDGDWKAVKTAGPAAPTARLTLNRKDSGTWQLVTAEGFDLGSPFPAAEQPSAASISMALDETASVAAIRGKVRNYALTGWEKARPVAEGKVVLGAK
jgi:hypothetical protein